MITSDGLRGILEICQRPRGVIDDAFHLSRCVRHFLLPVGLEQIPNDETPQIEANRPIEQMRVDWRWLASFSPQHRINYSLIAFFRWLQYSGSELLISSGLLVGLGFLINPIVHNYYFLLLMPLATALLADKWGLIHPQGGASPAGSVYVQDFNNSEGDVTVATWKHGMNLRRLRFQEYRNLGASLPLALWVFMLCDLAARLPKLGPVLRDCGFPLISTAFLMGASVFLLLRLRGVQSHQLQLEQQCAATSTGC